MQTVDILIGAFAIVAVVGSAIGAALYEPDEGGAEYDVNYASAERALDPASTTFQKGAQANAATGVVVHDMTQENITSISFSVVVRTSAIGQTALRAAGPSVNVVVEDPNGVERGAGTGQIGQTGTSVTIDIVIDDINPMPNATTVNANSTADADEIANRTVGENGLGNWTITATVSYSPGTLETGAVTSTPTITYYQGRAQLATADLGAAV